MIFLCLLPDKTWQIRHKIFATVPDLYQTLWKYEQYKFRFNIQLPQFLLNWVSYYTDKPNPLYKALVTSRCFLPAMSLEPLLPLWCHEQRSRVLIQLQPPGSPEICQHSFQAHVGESEQIKTGYEEIDKNKQEKWKSGLQRKLEKLRNCKTGDLNQGYASHCILLLKIK